MGVLIQIKDTLTYQGQKVRIQLATVLFTVRLWTRVILKELKRKTEWGMDWKRR